MGCDVSKNEADAASRQQSKNLDADLRKTKCMFDEIKILLLGIGESGKSTVAKQMKILYLNGFSEAERKQFVKAIHANILGSMKIFSMASNCSSQVTSVRKRSLANLPRYSDLKLPGEIHSSRHPIAALASIIRVKPRMMSPSPIARNSGASALQ